MRTKRLLSRYIFVVSVFYYLFFVFSISQAQKFVFDFENDAGLKDWEIIDESPKNIGKGAPSQWFITNGPIKGKALYQSSNIWGTKDDSCLMGTFIIYKGKQFVDFKMDVDVVSDDNDGMGIAWAFEGTQQHYRVIMINDKWPEVPVDKIRGPFMKMQKRVSDDDPWYELMEVKKGITYREKAPLHWQLSVKRGNFRFRRDDGKTIAGIDREYRKGYVGIQLYAQKAYFDNIVIESTWAVDPDKKVSTTWAQAKADRNY